jgi:hypothetical protein
MDADHPGNQRRQYVRFAVNERIRLQATFESQVTKKIAGGIRHLSAIHLVDTREDDLTSSVPAPAVSPNPVNSTRQDEDRDAPASWAFRHPQTDLPTSRVFCESRSRAIAIDTRYRQSIL